MVLIGHRIAYSASPAMQMAAFRACGLDWTYELLDVPAGELPGAVGRLRRPTAGGANVTIPHKMAVMRGLDELDAEAAAVGAVNTVLCRDGRLIGRNTDVAGVRAALDEIGLAAAGLRAVVLGGGGSARAASAALEGARLAFVVRRPASARDLPGEIWDWGSAAWREEARAADLVVNATPLGRAGENPLEAGGLPREGAVLDLVYGRGGTPLIRQARAAGLRCADGWSVLVAQGAASFEAWTGLAAPLTAMWAALPR